MPQPQAFGSVRLSRRAGPLGGAGRQPRRGARVRHGRGIAAVANGGRVPRPARCRGRRCAPWALGSVPRDAAQARRCGQAGHRGAAGPNCRNGSTTWWCKALRAGE